MSQVVMIQPCGYEGDRRHLDFRQREVLTALSEDRRATYSFQGLRRKLGFHQEMLSRTLDRLEEEELVERTNDGYRINTTTSLPLVRDTSGAMPIEMQVITAYLPLEVDANSILGALKGKWIGELRWLGYSETPSALALNWITEDGHIQIRARIVKGSIKISAFCQSRTDEERAVESTYELFDFITKQSSSLVRHQDLS